MDSPGEAQGGLKLPIKILSQPIELLQGSQTCPRLRNWVQGLSMM